MDPGMDSGTYTFVMDIPPEFERDLLAERHPKIQLNIDATQMRQAFTGNRYIQSIVTGEVNSFLKGHRTTPKEPVNLVVRYKFNPTLEPIWFGAVMQLINQITMLAVILTGAALIREREHGTLEHLLVMPLTPFEIMAAKICANGLVVLLASSVSLCFVIQGILRMPVAGSVPLFIFGTALHLFSVTSLGIFLGTVSRTMPQLGLLMMLVILPLQMLSGGSTPFESMPKAAQILMQAAPTTHFVSFAQAILYRGAGFGVIWPNFLAIIGIGMIFFMISSALFRKSMAAAR
jgi:ABC-2 type transport system permease protein